MTDTNVYFTSTLPTVEVHRSFVNTKDRIIKFTPFNDEDNNCKSLQRYNFDRSVENEIGSFSFTFEENRDDTLFDKIHNLDIVVIYEKHRTEKQNLAYQERYAENIQQEIEVEKRLNEDRTGLKKMHFNSLRNNAKIPAFIGVVESKSISATAGTNQKLCTISGSSIESLFTKFNIAIDATSFAYANTIASGANKELLDGIFSKNQGKEGVSVKELAKKVFEDFLNVSTNELKDITSTSVAEIIKQWYGDDFLDCSNLEMILPIANPAFVNNSTCSYIDYLHSILPKEVYNIYGYIDKEGKPKIKIEMKPYSMDEWNKLAEIRIYPKMVTDYALTQSCNEVYTAFFTYVEGSTQSPDFYQKIEASGQGYKTAGILPEKIAKYGYKPLFCSFSGYDISSNDKAEQDFKNSTLDEKCGILNEKMKEWYEHNDEYYNGSFTCVLFDGINYPFIGDRLKYDDVSFYVNSESHSWSYGTSISVKYDCTRGGIYNNGNFIEVRDLSRYLKGLVK